MTLSAPPPLEVAAPPTDVAYLLLGDLRLLLEETPDVATSRWIVSVLDWLLANPVQLDQIQACRTTTSVEWNGSSNPDGPFYAKLQTLRDRVAHRKPYALLANEVRCDLRELFLPH